MSRSAADLAWCAMSPAMCLLLEPDLASETASAAAAPAESLALATAIETSGPVPIGGYFGLASTAVLSLATWALAVRFAR